MSYSRWSNSYWYTFWCCPFKGFEHGMDEATFEICGITNFKYWELKEDIEKCIHRVTEILEDEKMNELPTSEDYEELKGYMKEFIKDVENEFKEEKGN